MENLPIWIYIIIVFLILALAALTFLYWCQRLRIAALAPLASKNDELQTAIGNYEKAFTKVKGAAQSFIDMRDGMRKVAACSTALQKLEALHALLEQVLLPKGAQEGEQGTAEKKAAKDEGLKLLNMVFNEAETKLEIAEDAMPIIKKLQNRIVNFQGELNMFGMGDVQEQKIRTDFLDLTFMMMDILDSINNSNYLPSHQGINLRLLTEETTEDQAYEEASAVTDDDRVTPQWARTMHHCLAEWAGTEQRPLIRQKPYLLNGYKFEFLKELSSPK